jgi:hypothetical protein
LDEGRELTGKEPVRAERDTEVFKGKGSFRELGEVKNGLLHIPRYTCKENRGLGCINYKSRGLPKDSKLLEDCANRDHVTAAEQKNIINKTKVTNSQSLAFWMEVKTRVLFPSHVGDGN